MGPFDKEHLLLQFQIIGQKISIVGDVPSATHIKFIAGVFDITEQGRGKDTGQVILTAPNALLDQSQSQIGCKLPV